MRPAVCLDPYFAVRGWFVPQVEPPGLFSPGEAAITTGLLCKRNQCAAGRSIREFSPKRAAPARQNTKAHGVVILSCPILSLPEPSS